MRIIARLDDSLEAFSKRLRGAPRHAVQIALPKLRVGPHAVAPDLLDSSSVAFSVGVTPDAGFERALIDRFGCAVHGFESEPRDLEDGADRTRPPQLQLHAPTAGGLVVCMQRVMHELGYGHVDLLRLDLKGAEYAAIASLAQADFRPGQLVIGFWHHMPYLHVTQTERALTQLNELGYRIFDCDSSGRAYSLALV